MRNSEVGAALAVWSSKIVCDERTVHSVRENRRSHQEIRVFHESLHIAARHVKITD
jgi:hypothetical protein